MVVDKVYLELLERVAKEARVIDKVMISFITDDAETLNLTALMVAVRELNDYEDLKGWLPT